MEELKTPLPFCISLLTLPPPHIYTHEREETGQYQPSLQGHVTYTQKQSPETQCTRSTLQLAKIYQTPKETHKEMAYGSVVESTFSRLMSSSLSLPSPSSIQSSRQMNSCGRSSQGATLESNGGVRYKQTSEMTMKWGRHHL